MLPAPKNPKSAFLITLPKAGKLYSKTGRSGYGLFHALMTAGEEILSVSAVTTNFIQFAGV